MKYVGETALRENIYKTKQLINNHKDGRFVILTQAEYNQLRANEELETDVLYIISDDTTEARLLSLEARVTALENK